MRKLILKMAGWLSKHFDKVLHFGVCAIVVLWLTPLTSLFSAAFIAVLLGCLKEFVDSRTEGNKWDWWDIVADVLGIVASAVPLYFIIH